MKMGLSYGEARKLTLGRWTDLFEEYKQVHNIIVTGTPFPQPKEEADGVEAFFADMRFDGEDYVE